MHLSLIHISDVNQIAAVYEKYRENPKTAYLGCSMGIIYRDPEDSYYDEAEFAIVKGNTVFGNLMDDVRFYGDVYKRQIQGADRKMVEKIPEAAFREAIANALIHRVWDINSVSYTHLISRARIIGFRCIRSK